jgi:hypothetical protein
MLSTQPLAPGHYQLTLKVTDKIAQKTASQSVQFDLETSGAAN